MHETDLSWSLACSRCSVSGAGCCISLLGILQNHIRLPPSGPLSDPVQISLPGIVRQKLKVLRFWIVCATPRVSRATGPLQSISHRGLLGPAPSCVNRTPPAGPHQRSPLLWVPRHRMVAGGEGLGLPLYQMSKLSLRKPPGQATHRHRPLP